MTDTRERTVVVIGAGLAGLAAARQLKQAGIQVTILEKDLHVGGRVNTEIVDGFHIETGAQFMAKFYDRTLALIQDLGLQDDAVPILGGAAIRRDGQLYEVWPPNASLLFNNLLSFRSKLLLVKMLGPLMQHWKNLDIHAFYQGYPFDTNTVAGYVHQELDDELLEYLFQPPLAAIVYWTPEHTSQVMIFLLFKFALSMKLITLHHGLGQLPKAIAANLQVRCNAEVSKVTVNADNSYTVGANVDGQEMQFNADGIVSAIPATMVSGLFAGLNSKQQAFFDAINYSSTVSVHIGLDRRIPSSLYGIFYPRREAKYLSAAVIQSAKDPTQTPTGRDMLALFASGAASKDLLDKDDTFIQDTFLAELQQLGFFFDLKDHILFTRVNRTPQAIPEFDVGHFKRLKTFKDGEIESGRVVFAGDYIGGPFIEGAITSGIEAAQRLLNQLNEDRKE